VQDLVEPVQMHSRLRQKRFRRLDIRESASYEFRSKCIWNALPEFDSSGRDRACRLTPRIPRTDCIKHFLNFYKLCGTEDLDEVVIEAGSDSILSSQHGGKRSIGLEPTERPPSCALTPRIGLDDVPPDLATVVSERADRISAAALLDQTASTVLSTRRSGSVANFRVDKLIV
jgi:hypothetical protein